MAPQSLMDGLMMNPLVYWWNIIETFPKTNEWRIQGDDRENEIEDNLQAIDCMVANLKNMAVDMSSEITDQNQQLARIEYKVNYQPQPASTTSFSILILFLGSFQWDQSHKRQQEGGRVIEKLKTFKIDV